MRWLIVLFVLGVGLGACSSGNPGKPGHSTASSAVIATYDVHIYLCTSGDPSCAGATSAAQTATFRSLLLADPAVRAVRYTSADDAYRLAKRALPKVAAERLKPGDLPASFFIDLTDPGKANAFSARYAHRTGVSTARPCRAEC